MEAWPGYEFVLVSGSEGNCSEVRVKVETQPVLPVCLTGPAGAVQRARLLPHDTQLRQPEVSKFAVLASYYTCETLPLSLHPWWGVGCTRGGAKFQVES